MVMTTEPTWVDRTFPLWRLPRVQLFGKYSLGKLKLKMAVAAAGGILSNPDGTGKSYRAFNRLYGRSGRLNHAGSPALSREGR
jgi:hypothetical protein